jgi:RimJ/RimL family protein N-acetyltransferase
MFPSSQILTSPRFLLRPHQMEDAPVIAKVVRESMPEFGRYMPWARVKYSAEDARLFIGRAIVMRENEAAYEFLILDAKTNVILGGCGLNRFDHENKTGNLGYWVRTNRTRQGIATEAAQLLLKFGFEELKLNRIEIIAEVTNIASQRVAEKVGAVREGVMRKRLLLHGEAHDAVLFAVVR